MYYKPNVEKKNKNYKKKNLKVLVKNNVNTVTLYLRVDRGEEKIL